MRIESRCRMAKAESPVRNGRDQPAGSPPNADATRRGSPTRSSGSRRRPHARTDFAAADAFVWQPEGAPARRRSPRVNRVEMSLLKGIDRVRDTAGREHRALRQRPARQQCAAVGRARHGQVVAGQGRACRGQRQRRSKSGTLKLVEIHREDIESLPELMALLRGAPYRFIVFCDDLSFDADDTSYKSLKAVLEGGIEGRPENVIFYATSNRRHLMPRDMMENERSTAINPGEAVEEKVSLSDRFGLWLGFHRCSQDEYLAMVEGYVAHFRIPAERRRAARARRWNGRRRAARAPAAWPGNTCRISRDGSACGCRAEHSGRQPSPPLARYCVGSTGVEPLRISKCSCGAVTVPVWPDLAIDLAALDAVAALHHQLAGVRIGGDEAVGVAHQHEVAVALELVAGIGDDAVLGRLDRRAFRHREIDAVVLLPVRLRPEAGDDAAAHRPAEARHRGGRRRPWPSAARACAPPA